MEPLEGRKFDSRLRCYATSPKVTGSSPDDAMLGPGAYSASNRNEYQETFLGSRVRPAHNTDNPIAICEPIVYTMWDPQHLTIL
jgi:hypothetical protein